MTRYLPELAGRDPRFADISIANLLDMRSGILYSSDIEFPFINADNALIYFFPDLESIVLERTAVAAPPGEFQYNNYNPPLIGLILRRTTGTPVGANLGDLPAVEPTRLLQTGFETLSDDRAVVVRVQVGQWRANQGAHVVFLGEVLGQSRFIKGFGGRKKQGFEDTELVPSICRWKCRDIGNLARIGVFVRRGALIRCLIFVVVVGHVLCLRIIGRIGEVITYSSVSGLRRLR